MIVAAVLDPRELDPKKFTRQCYETQVKELFKGIRENGLLIIDPNGQLKDDIHRAIEGLPSSCSDIRDFWIEILKLGKRRIVKCRGDAYGGSTSKELDQILKRLGDCCALDAIFSSDLNSSRTTSLASYTDSEFERNRRALILGSSPLDKLSRKEVDELIIRAVRFSKSIKFYDKQLGRADSVSGFRKGIEYVLSLWQDNGHFSGDRSSTVTIYTIEKHRADSSDDEYTQSQKQKNNLSVKTKLERELLKPLSQKFHWNIELCIKSDPNYICHSRHLETQVAVLRTDFGFDFFDAKGNFKRNQLCLDNAFAEHLREYRALPDSC